jgi:hypothetical protein
MITEKTISRITIIRKDFRKNKIIKNKLLTIKINKNKVIYFSKI